MQQHTQLKLEKKEREGGRKLEREPYWVSVTVMGGEELKRCFLPRMAHALEFAKLFNDMDAGLVCESKFVAYISLSEIWVIKICDFDTSHVSA